MLQSRITYPTVLLVAVSAFVALFKFIVVVTHQSFDFADGLAYLDNAAYLAGSSNFSSGLDLFGYTPGLQFMLSLLFRITGPSLMVDWGLSVVLFFVSMISCYWISKQTTNPLVAVLASFSFAVSPQVYQWVGAGITNVEGVSLAALSFAVVIGATNGSKRLYLVAFPLMAVATLTRFTMGTVIVPVAVYMVLQRGRVRPHLRYVFAGLVLAALVGALISYQWLAYAWAHNYLAILWPQPSSVASPLGGQYYSTYFASNLALGIYGQILAGLFICSIIYIVVLTVRRAYSKIDAALLAILAWFLALFLYYSVLWPSQQPRYSLEFAMPVVVVGFWFLSRVVGFLSSQVKLTTEKRWSILSLAIIVGIALSVTYPALQSSQQVMRTAPYSYGIVEYSSVNVAVQQAATWLQSNVPSSVRVSSNGDGNLLHWYAPDYVVDSFYPASNCNLLGKQLSQKNDKYLILIPGLDLSEDSGCPFSSVLTNATIQSRLGIVPVHRVPITTSDYDVYIGNVTVFKVSN